LTDTTLGFVDGAVKQRNAAGTVSHGPDNSAARRDPTGGEAFQPVEETRLLNGGQLLTIMSNSIAYLTSRTEFLQVSPEIPITKQRNPEKYDPPEVFEGELYASVPCHSILTFFGT
jgi:hypothetical protein